MRKILFTISTLCLFMSCEVAVYESKTQKEGTTAPSLERIEFLPNSADSTIRVRIWARGGKLDDLWDASLVDSCRVRCDSGAWVYLKPDSTMDEGPSSKAFKFSGYVKDSIWYPIPSWGYFGLPPIVDMHIVDIFGRTDSYTTGSGVPMQGDTLQRYAGLGNRLM